MNQIVLIVPENDAKIISCEIKDAFSNKQNEDSARAQIELEVYRSAFKSELVLTAIVIISIIADSMQIIEFIEDRILPRLRKKYKIEIMKKS